MNKVDRREFLKALGLSAATAPLAASIERALAITADHRTGTLADVDHIVILMQENRPFDHHFGTLRGVRGFSDPRAVQIHLPLRSGAGTTSASVFMQPAGPANTAAGFGVRPESVGGPADAVDVIPPLRIDPQALGARSLGGTYLPGTDHGWRATHEGWNEGRYDGWARVNGPMAMTYMTRDDLPFHCALADAFTVCDAYYCSIMAPTVPNRTYLFAGGIGNRLDPEPGGTDGHGAGPMIANGLSPNDAYWSFGTFPEVLTRAGVSWKVYQDLAGQTFAPDFGESPANPFTGNFGDNPLLYFAQYATAAPGSPLFEQACTGTRLSDSAPPQGAPAAQWAQWQEQLFSQLRRDVADGTLPQVSWIVGPAGYSEHSDYPIDYGAWFISKVLDALTSNPKVFSRTVLLVNYDEADGSFDHVPPPFAPAAPQFGASTVDARDEIVSSATPAGPIGLGTRVPMLVISPWSRGGYVNSQVFDHTSVIQFIERRFGVHEPNISAWRRTVCGDLTSAFNFSQPSEQPVQLPSTAACLPPAAELSGRPATTFKPKPGELHAGVPQQEPGLRPARALPYDLEVGIAVRGPRVVLEFLNHGRAGAVFQVRSGDPLDKVRAYTVEAGKRSSGTWTARGRYDLWVHGPNGFLRHFKGSTRPHAPLLRVQARHEFGDEGAALAWQLHNAGSVVASVNLLDAYEGRRIVHQLYPHESLTRSWALEATHGWYDLVVTVAEDGESGARICGHVETRRDSWSDPALGGAKLLA